MARIPKIPDFLKTVSHDSLLPTKAVLMHPATDTDTANGVFRIFLAWAAYFFGSITLQNVGVSLAIVFTTLQIIVILRDKFGFFIPKEKT